MLHFTADVPGVRLDVFVSRASGKSRAQVQALIEKGGVCVNGVARRAGYRLAAGDAVTVAEEPPRVLAEALGEDIPLDIVYQDGDIAVINKPQGMVVHPGPGNENGTLVNALLFALGDLSGIGGVLRPGIVHRIDKLTSGLLVVAKNDMAHASLSQQLKEHTARRRYLAILEGNIREEEGTVDAPIARHPADRKRMAVVREGREAITHWRVLARTGKHTLIEAELETGRTHQIRVHMKHIQHPVAGDAVYGRASLGLEGQALHAYSLCLAHPRTGEELRFFAPPPGWFLQAMKRAGFAQEEIEAVKERPCTAYLS